MSEDQVTVLIGIAVFAIFFYYKFLHPIMNKNAHDFDEIDISVAKFKRRRAEQGLCIYCGSALDEGLKRPGRGSICLKCRDEMYPSA